MYLNTFKNDFRKLVTVNIKTELLTINLRFKNLMAPQGHGYKTIDRSCIWPCPSCYQMVSQNITNVYNHIMAIKYSHKIQRVKRYTNHINKKAHALQNIAKIQQIFRNKTINHSSKKGSFNRTAAEGLSSGVLCKAIIVSLVVAHAHKQN